jgi:hypothetical protein
MGRDWPRCFGLRDVRGVMSGSCQASGNGQFTVPSPDRLNESHVSPAGFDPDALSRDQHALAA